MNYSIVLVCHIILKRMKSLDYEAGNKNDKVIWFSGGEITGDSFIGSI